MATLIVFGVIAFVIFIWVMGTYNKIVSLKNYFKEAFSTMDVYLKKRWDLVPNLVETVKGYASHEKDTLEKVIKLRNQNYGTLSQSEKMNLNNQLSMGLSQLIAVAENYPDLKANENFNQLQRELSAIEDDIANSRKYYNGTTREYNTYIELFPNCIIANMFNFRAQKLFEIEENERQNVKVSF